MQPQTLHTLELAAATVGQTILLAAAWGFLGAVLAENTLHIPDVVANLIYSRPTETTWVVTLLATMVSVATTTYAFIIIAIKEALRHRMRKSISLIHLSGWITLAEGSYLINIRHLGHTFMTLAVFAVTKLLVSSWTALLAPTYVTWNATASGWELDITSSWFESTLQQELIQSGAALVRGNSTEILNLDGVLSGIAAAQYSLGESGIFNFNGVKYNITTGGVLPAAPGYEGSTNPVSNSNTGLAFAGGLVPTNLTMTFAEGRTLQGLNHSFQLHQQGLTANVTCHQADTTTDNLNLNSSFYPMPVPSSDGTTAYWLWAWNITGDCSEGIPSRQQFVTRSNSSTVPQSSSSGLMASLVCPYPLLQTGFSWENFTVVINASWRYDFLPLTICTINPVVTTSLVSYSNGVINTQVISARPLGDGNTNLTQFLAVLVDYQSETVQSLTTNSIGDALYSIYVSLSSSNSTSAQNLTDTLLWEMEQYWRGVIEFTGTFLRSGFSVHTSTLPVEAQIPLTGYEKITTMGWYRRSVVWGYMIIPITFIALMMYAAVAYTLWHVILERREHKYFTRFDPSNPIHLMMVSSARNPGDESVNLDRRLDGFDGDGIGHNEKLRVEVEDVDRSDRKRFKVTSRLGMTDMSPQCMFVQTSPGPPL